LEFYLPSAANLIPRKRISYEKGLPVSQETGRPETEVGYAETLETIDKVGLSS
jgi:hypothetical protein